MKRDWSDIVHRVCQMFGRREKLDCILVYANQVEVWLAIISYLCPDVERGWCLDTLGMILRRDRLSHKFHALASDNHSFPGWQPCVLWTLWIGCHHCDLQPLPMRASDSARTQVPCIKHAHIMWPTLGTQCILIVSYHKCRLRISTMTLSHRLGLAS